MNFTLQFFIGGTGKASKDGDSKTCELDSEWENEWETDF